MSAQRVTLAVGGPGACVMLGSLQINSSALFTGKIFILSRGGWCLRERQSAEGHIE